MCAILTLTDLKGDYMDFEYQASVIVPVYNVEQYLRICLDSLVNQTIDKKRMEVLVINDGSPDNSWDICREYSEKYDFIKIFSKENEGLSATRNFGIKHAKGKYMFFLDSDDYFTPETVKKVTDFFDKVYDEVDLVTYNETRYRDDVILKPHFRFKMLDHKGVYDLNEYPYLTQTRVNVCVKNMGEKNVLFNTTPGFKLEDQEYCNRVLMAKMKMGYCPHGTYMYNKGNETSIMKMYFHAFYLFETSMEYFETLFATFPDKVPPYFQAMFVNDINWRLSDDILYPYHYEGEKFEKAMRRIVDLLNRVDSKTILEHPMVDVYRACYWIKKKENAEIAFDCTDDGILLTVDGEEVYSQEDLVVIGHKPRVEGDIFRLTAFMKSPIFTFLNDDEYAIYAVENGKRKKLDLFTSVHSNYRAKIITNPFPAFHYSCNLKENNKIRFEIDIKGHTYSSHYWFMQYSGFGLRFIRKINRGRYMIKNKKKYLSVKPATQRGIDFNAVFNTARFAIHPRTAMLRLKSIDYRKKHRIWLYYDFYTVEKDNGYYQFINDLKHDDGVERYYVLTHEYDDLNKLFTAEQQKHLVKAGSREHRLLFICAERIFTAYYGLAPVNPFETAKMEYQYNDLIKSRTIYLQHGVLHASLRLLNSEERSQAEEIVVSSPFEVKNYMQNYAYEKRELITTGMARYDHIDRNHKPQNRILFAPSWRKYLTTEVKASNWEANVEKIQKSDYYKNFYKFLSDKNLHKKLESSKVYLDIKLHPIIANLTDLFDIDCEYVNMVGDVEVADYKAFVTDFSSFVFDFAYLNRPVMYFVPDYPQFKSGMNHYRDLDLPFEDAFGHMFTDAHKAAECLCNIIDRDFVPEEPFGERMKNFYFDFDGNCAENLYKFVTEQDKEFSK